MPYCPECGAEYRKGFQECSECGVELLEDEDDGLFPEDDDEDEEEEEDEDPVPLAVVAEAEFVEIYNGPPYAANMVANALKARGITATVKPDTENSLLAPAEADVLVSEADYNDHDDVIQECLELVETAGDHGVLFESGEAE